MGFHRNSTISYYLNEGKKKHIFKEGMYIHIQNHWFNKGKNHSKFLKNQYHYIAGYTGKNIFPKRKYMFTFTFKQFKEVRNSIFL